MSTIVTQDVETIVEALRKKIGALEGKTVLISGGSGSNLFAVTRPTSNAFSVRAPTLSKLMTLLSHIKAARKNKPRTSIRAVIAVITMSFLLVTFF